MRTITHKSLKNSPMTSSPDRPFQSQECSTSSTFRTLEPVERFSR
jgi:hypothetical protein